MKRARNMRRHIPAELVEEILLKLPVKSLLRFSTVSKSWKSTILGGEFATRYRGREMTALKLYSEQGNNYVACPISALSTDAAAPLPPLPFDADWYTDVSCGALRCVAAGDTLRLYNPSTGAHRQLPCPSCPRGAETSSVHVYGLGYDSADGDYKMVKSHIDLGDETELYSLNSDSWRIVSDSKRKIQLCLSGVTVRFLSRKAVFLDGKLHWAVQHSPSRDRVPYLADILTFDLTTESYGKVVAMPALPEAPLLRLWLGNRMDALDVFLLRGRLGLCLGDGIAMFYVWVMEEDGAWTKDMAFIYRNTQPLCYSSLKPFYFYDGDGISVVKAVTTPLDIRKYFIYKEKQEEDGLSVSLVKKSFVSKGHGILTTFTFFESLVSPFPPFK